jgi:hypothetical protein
MTAKPPVVTRAGGAMTFAWAGARIELDRFSEDHDELKAEFLAYSTIPGREGLLSVSRLNLLAESTRTNMAKKLSKKIDELDWDEMLEQMTFRALELYREGDPSIDLKSITPSAEVWTHYPYVENPGPSLFAAEGSSGKSMVALDIGHKVTLGGNAGPGRTQNRAIKVLYLDWETGADEHARRLRAIAAGEGLDWDAVPPMGYRYMTASLPASADNLRREIAEEGIGLVIVDSLGAAAAGPPEDSAVIMPVFQALRGFKCSSLVLHHKRKKGMVTNSGGGNADRDRIFGSVYTLNYARLVWDIESKQDEGSSELNMGFQCVKRNNGRLLPRHAISMSFETDEFETIKSVKIQRKDMSDVPAFAERVSLWARVSKELSRGAGTPAELAERLNVENVQLVRNAITTLKDKGDIIKIPTGQWALAARDTRI